MLKFLEKPKRTTNMRRQPPTWLYRWSFLASALLGFVKNLIIQMLKATKLGIFPRDWLSEAIPPHIEAKVQVKDCPHTSVKRYGNLHGRFAQCVTCGLRMKWDPQAELWVHKPLQASSRSLPLSLTNTVVSAPKSRAKPKPSTRASAASASSMTTSSQPKRYNIADSQPTTEGYAWTEPQDIYGEPMSSYEHHSFLMMLAQEPDIAARLAALRQEQAMQQNFQADEDEDSQHDWEALEG